MYALLLYTGLKLTVSNPSSDRSSYVCIIKSLESPFEQQVSDLDEYESSCRFFDTCDTKFVPRQSITPVNFSFSSEVDLIDYKSSGLGTIETSLVNSALTMPLVEDRKVVIVSTKVTYIEYFILNMILILLFLGDRILSWIHNCLLALLCC